MSTTLIQQHMARSQRRWNSHFFKGIYYLRHCYCQRVIFAICILPLLMGSVLIAQQYSRANAAELAIRNACLWHRIHRGETLNSIAWQNHTTVATLMNANTISSADQIQSGRLLCIPQAATSNGFLSDGSVRWYAYSALQMTTTGQVSAELHQAAVLYQLPIQLLLAIAWQESGWNQHVIAYDGGIGVMQIMPYTANMLNRQTGHQYNPYLLWDNIRLGAIYLCNLRALFHGDIQQIISAYNEGSWSVVHQGIFNWSYVRSVQMLMRRF